MRGPRALWTERRARGAAHRRWLPRRRWTLWVGGLLAVVLVGGGAWALVTLPSQWACGSLTDEVVEQDGECVGVSDGGFRFAFGGGSSRSVPGEAREDDERERAEEGLRDVQERIKEENDRVTGSDEEAVTVALFTTLTLTDTSPLTPQRVLHSVEGAHVAQMRANHGKALGDPTPQIRLVLANAGSRQQHWGTPVATLDGMRDDAAPLVAVTGFAVSTEETKQAAERLSARGIPMVSSVASADGLHHRKIPGLIRVTPANADFTAALRAYARDREPDGEAMLVFDRRTSDLHVTSLTRDYRETLKPWLKDIPEQGFDGTTLEENASPALFDTAVSNACLAKPDFIPFSGRPADLEAFLDSLENRVCQKHPMKVLFMETGEVVDVSQAPRLKKHGVTVVQASSSDPSWAPGGAGVPAGFAGFHAAYDTYVPDVPDVGDALRDGYAIGHHDAVMAAVRSARIAHSEAPGEGLTAERVHKALFTMNLAHKVRAAGGTLSFTVGRGGDPGGKPVPVQEIPRGPEPPKVYVTPES